MDYFRSRAQRQKSQNIPLDDAWNLPESAVSASQDEATELLQDAIACLPIHLREPLVLTALEGFSHEEAGRRLGISSKAVEVKCYRARERIRTFLKKHPNA
jgi:RNA polymerase sigma factor (sigma-70 family)